MANIQERVASIEKEICCLQTLEQKVAVCKQTCSNTNDQLLVLLAKVDNLENRSQRNNLTIFCFSEEPDEDWKTLETRIKKDYFKRY